MASWPPNLWEIEAGARKLVAITVQKLKKSFSLSDTTSEDLTDDDDDDEDAIRAAGHDDYGEDNHIEEDDEFLVCDDMTPNVYLRTLYIKMS